MTNTIRYATGQSALGPFVAALSERGLALVEFGEPDLEARFPDADLVEDAAALEETLAKLAALIDHPEDSVEFALDLRGSPFELKVWQALRE
ncbi:MAG: methylated-DNA--[protein]-cysteine S-methyltransferase, partial [Solimonas sp.]